MKTIVCHASLCNNCYKYFVTDILLLLCHENIVHSLPHKYFCLISISSRVVVEAGTSETKTETWVAETKTETKAI